MAPIEIPDPSVIPLIGHTNWVNSVAFSPDGKYIVSGSNDNTLKIWELKSGALCKSLTGYRKWVYSIRFFPKGDKIVVNTHNVPETESEDNNFKYGACVLDFGKAIFRRDPRLPGKFDPTMI